MERTLKIRSRLWLTSCKSFTFISAFSDCFACKASVIFFYIIDILFKSQSNNCKRLLLFIFICIYFLHCHTLKNASRIKHIPSWLFFQPFFCFATTHLPHTIIFELWPEIIVSLNFLLTISFCWFFFSSTSYYENSFLTFLHHTIQNSKKIKSNNRMFCNKDKTQKK
jgi:hypothetical protein